MTTQDKALVRITGKAIRRSSELPNDEGSVFVAWVDHAPCHILGRRGRDGQLYVGSVFARKNETLKQFEAAMRRSESATGVPIEVVTGAEAELLFNECQLEWNEIKPN